MSLQDRVSLLSTCLSQIWSKSPCVPRKPNGKQKDLNYVMYVCTLIKIYCRQICNVTMQEYQATNIFCDLIAWISVLGIPILHRLMVCIWFPRDTKVLTLDSVELGGVPSAKLHAIPPLVCSIDFLVLFWKPVPSAAAQESRQLDHEVHGPQWQFTEKSHISYTLRTLIFLFAYQGTPHNKIEYPFHQPNHMQCHHWSAQ